MTHSNAPLSIEGRRRLVERCKIRPIAHVAAERGTSRACASKWVNRHRRHGALGLWIVLQHRGRNHVPPPRGGHKWSAERIAFELDSVGVVVSRHTVSRHLHALGLNRRKFIDPNGDTNYHRPHGAASGQPPASRLLTGVTNVLASYIVAGREVVDTRFGLTIGRLTNGQGKGERSANW